jgi:hypothetical protein
MVQQAVATYGNGPIPSGAACMWTSKNIGLIRSLDGAPFESENRQTAIHMQLANMAMLKEFCPFGTITFI